MRLSFWLRTLRTKPFCISLLTAMVAEDTVMPKERASSVTVQPSLFASPRQRMRCTSLTDRVVWRLRLSICFSSRRTLR